MTASKSQIHAASRDRPNSVIRRAFVGSCLSTVLLLMFLWLWNETSASSSRELLTLARKSLATGRPDIAAKAITTLLDRDPASALALELAAKSASQNQKFQNSLDYLQRIPADGSPIASRAEIEIGNLLQSHLGRPTDAEAQFRKILQRDPNHLLANYRMAYLLGLGGRYREAIPFRLTLLQQGQVEAVSLYLLCSGGSVLENVELLKKVPRTSARDPLLQLGLARHAINAQQESHAVQLLQQVVAAHPEWVAAQALLGKILLNSLNEAAFRQWHDQLPANAEEDPDVWSIRGTWAQQQQQYLAAIRCFAEAVQRDPTHERANWQLAQLLTEVGNHQQAQPFLYQSQQLGQLFDAVTQAWTGRNMEAVRKASQLAEELGLIWEAYGWARLMLNDSPLTPWAQETVRRLHPQLATLDLRRCPSGRDLTSTLSLADLPLPKISTPDIDQSVMPLSVDHHDQPVGIAFVDSAADTQLRFQYCNGNSAGQATRRMYEFNGGGVAVIDFDLDDWPDIYLPQGCLWPADPASTRQSDRMFRNSGRSHFSDVTTEAGLVEQDFSAGVTVSDYDNDGWPDLYVTNIGANRLLHNNGDGTWSDVTIASGTAGDDWSTSCVMADLNGDAWPDLYVVNYLSDANVFERLCPDQNGVTRSCSPRDFHSAQDRLYTNLGDGRFRDDTAASGICVPDGKGLGIVAADFSDRGKIDIFVANDAVPNFYFVNQASAPGNAPQFSDHSLTSGLAMNGDGQSEACMGVAAGDVNGDHQLDLFTTNFHNETNTLYQQQGEGIFSDATQIAGLHRPSLKMLGFGTQFFDANLDGNLDLIVANGHIDDLSDLETPYQMPPQCFHGNGKGAFQLLSAESLGAYFCDNYLGRALARLDWNRDGRPDAVVTHLDDPVALLTNCTPAVGNYLKVKLTGIDASRDAIGTTVTVLAGERQLTQQLTAGDGFQCSNERELIFGLGTATMIRKLSVRWPSGREQEFHQLIPNRLLRLIEGRIH